MKKNIRNIFVDTNVLINALTGKFTNKSESKTCLDYLISIKNKNLYTSSLSVVTMFSVLQKSKKSRPAFSIPEIKEYYDKICAKFIILNCTKADITACFNVSANDLEDNVQYVLGRKFDCKYFITENKPDFENMRDIIVLKPQQVFVIKTKN